MRVLLLVNPRAGSFDEPTLKASLASLTAQGHTAQVYLLTDSRDEIRRLFSREITPPDRLIVAGGDGTLQRAIEALVDLPFPLPPIAIIPAGTGNDFAGALGIPDDWEEALSLAVTGEVVEIDLGRANQRPFANSSSGGIGAETMAAAEVSGKHLLGRLAYWVTGARKFVTLTPGEATFTVDGEEVYQGAFLAFTVGNNWRVGGNFRICPRANLQDGLLDLCIIRAGVPLLDLISLLRKIRDGAHLGDPAIFYTRGQSIDVVARRPLSVTLDGEPAEFLQVHYRVEPKRLKMIASSSAQLFVQN